MSIATHNAIFTGQPGKDFEMSENASPVAPVENVVTCPRFNGWWAPVECPITLLKFFMWIEHPDKGWVPTYGGPFDSYTIPEPTWCDSKNRFDVEYLRYRFDHDQGGWTDECEIVRERVVLEETLIDLGAWPD